MSSYSSCGTSRAWSTSEYVTRHLRLISLVLASLGIVPGSEEGMRAEEIWARVVELEAAFWPDGEDEVALLSK